MALKTFVKTSANYIPISDIEDLLLRAKHALKEEAKIWNERAHLERDYANSLKAWSAKSKKIVEVNHQLEHSPVRVGMIVTLLECEATAALHEKVADLISGTGGPSCNLVGYRTKNFKTDLELDRTLFNRRDRVLQYFESCLVAYREAVKDCIKTVTAVELATKEELDIRKQIENKKNKIMQMKKGYGKSMYYREKILQLEKYIIDLEGLLATTLSKKNQSLTKAKYILNEKADILEEKVQEIVQWETDRIKYVRYQFSVALDYLSLLGPEASLACREANAVLTRINPEQIVDEWAKNKISEFSIEDKFSSKDDRSTKEMGPQIFRSRRRRENKHNTDKNRYNNLPADDGLFLKEKEQHYSSDFEEKIRSYEFEPTRENDRSPTYKKSIDIYNAHKKTHNNLPTDGGLFSNEKGQQHKIVFVSCLEDKSLPFEEQAAGEKLKSSEFERVRENDRSPANKKSSGTRHSNPVEIVDIVKY